MAATILLMGAGVLTGHALGDAIPVPPVPTVPTVTVSTPVVTVPISVPTLPQPPVVTTPVNAPDPTSPAPITTATAAPAPTLPATSSVVGSAIGGSSSGPGLASGGSSSSPGSSSSSGSSALHAGSFSSVRGYEAPRVERFHSSRSWIATAGPKSRRTLALTFSLLHAERLFFVVQQVAPSCRTVEHFSVRGHAGKNRIRFPSPGSRLRLVPGTYRIAVQTRSGLLVQRITIVVVDRGKPSRDEIAAARGANVCAAARYITAARSSSGASNTSSLAGTQRGNSLGEGKNTGPGGVLGASLARAARAVEPLLVGLLALAIALLGIASLPRLATTGSAANELLDRYRMAIAGLGATALAAGLIMFLAG